MSQTKENEFKPTHKITFTPLGGLARVDLVMLCEDDPGAGGPMYTREEWDDLANASWECMGNGDVLCEGQATPGGQNGEVKIERVTGSTNPFCSPEQLERAAMFAEILASFDAIDRPELTGSPKQVSWATEIRDEVFAQLRRVWSADLAAFERGELLLPEPRDAKLEDARVLASITDAKTWIDARGMSPTQLARRARR